MPAQLSVLRQISIQSKLKQMVYRYSVFAGRGIHFFAQMRSSFQRRDVFIQGLVVLSAVTFLVAIAVGSIETARGLLWNMLAHNDKSKRFMLCRGTTVVKVRLIFRKRIVYQELSRYTDAKYLHA
ncbi:hypothetical protein QG37_07590 [Candidozyma auris]|nr:hypothetical protein QG37_07590 [[Candida] auris]